MYKKLLAIASFLLIVALLLPNQAMPRDWSAVPGYASAVPGAADPHASASSGVTHAPGYAATTRAVRRAVNVNRTNPSPGYASATRVPEWTMVADSSAGYASAARSWQAVEPSAAPDYVDAVSDRGSPQPPPPNPFQPEPPGADEDSEALSPDVPVFAGESFNCREDGKPDCLTGYSGFNPTWQWFGEYLLLRPRDAEVVYGVPYNASTGPAPGVPIQSGRMGTVDYGYDPAFRGGFARTLADGAVLSTTYARFESSVEDGLAVADPFTVRSMVAHSSTPNVRREGLAAHAAAGIDFDVVDLDYRGQFSCGRHHSLDYLIGARYAYMEQGFASRFGPAGLDTVLSDIRFDGGGIRFGLDGERRLANSRLVLYGRGVASFVVGEFDAIYAQGQSLDASFANTRWAAGRVVSILDIELGASLTSPNGRLRFSGGYMVSAWGNVVKTNDFIRAVQSNDFIGLGDWLSFDGVVVRAEYRF